MTCITQTHTADASEAQGFVHLNLSATRSEHTQQTTTLRRVDMSVSAQHMLLGANRCGTKLGGVMGAPRLQTCILGPLQGAQRRSSAPRQSHRKVLASARFRTLCDKFVALRKLDNAQWRTHNRSCAFTFLN